MLDCLVIAPHPDDAELGAAGLILQLKAEGRRVGVLDLTDGEPTPHGNPVLRQRETAEATRILQLDWRDNLGLPNRSLQPTLEARQKLATVLRQVRPNWLLAPYWMDAHPDHVAATQLIEDARFWAKLTRTEMPGEPHHPARILLLLLHSSASGRAAVIRAGHQPALAAEVGCDHVLPQPVHCRPRRAESQLPGPTAR